ncbi:MAG: LytTR family DNA-binding domain-containing protein [Candidatus Sulfotelmatobacter sp.]
MGPSAIHTVLADDEPLARKKLRILLEAEPGVEVVAECADGQQTIAAVEAHKPDLLLLDIRMPDADGFQILSEIPQEQMPIVVFTTAFDQYAIQAFEAQALDYVLKPFDEERLHHAIERVRAELLKSQNHGWTDRMLHHSAETRLTPQSMDRRLVIRTGGRVVFLDLDEVDWIEAAANYVKVNVGKDSYLLREAIGRISEKLDPGRFVRIHRSTIVNIGKIKELQPCDSGEYIAILKNGKGLSCSRTYRNQLQQLIDKAI